MLKPQGNDKFTCKMKGWAVHSNFFHLYLIYSHSVLKAYGSVIILELVNLKPLWKFCPWLCPSLYGSTVDYLINSCDPRVSEKNVFKHSRKKHNQLKCGNLDFTAVFSDLMANSFWDCQRWHQCDLISRAPQKEDYMAVLHCYSSVEEN